jgi:hypothetical protein
MNISGRIRSLLRGAALSAGVGAAFLAILLAGFGFMVAGLFIWLAQHLGVPLAAAATGGGLIIFALLFLAAGRAAIRKSRKRYPSLLAEFGGTIGMAGRLVGLLVRKDPKKALILSIIAGAVAEYISSERKP